MIALLLAAQALPHAIPNPGFERGLDGWTVAGHRGLRADVDGNRGYTIRRSYEGESFLNMGWRARNAAQPGAEIRVATRIDARRYRGRILRISAATKAPDFARQSSYMFASAGGAETHVRIDASEAWRRHSLTLPVARNADMIELGFVTAGTSGELDADDVRIEILP
jgi:hypothetical protein